MMELYDIVEASSKLVPKDKGALVLHRSIREHPKFKVYKKFCYDLYLVKGSSKEVQLHWDASINCPADDMLKIWNAQDKEFLGTFLIPWIASDLFKKLTDGV